VNMVKSIPTGWVASLCEGLLCYPPFLLDVELILDPGETLELIIDITAVGDEGQGSTLISLASKNNPASTASATFTLVSSGVDVLLVSNVSDPANENLIADAITATGKTHGVWRPSTMGKATDLEMANFPTIVWAAASTLTSLETEDMTNLTAYVNGGGNLVLSGQNLAWANCDPGSPFFDTDAVTWFQSTLGTDYVGNLGSTDFVTSQVSDPIFSGASFNVNGGDGSNDNSSPDIVSSTGLGTVSLSYSGGGGALIRSGLGAGYTVFAAFGIEGIDSVGKRSAFMTSALNWFTNPTSAAGDGVLPLFTRQPEVWPNPFNPQTKIRFEVGGERAVPAEVTVYNLQGRAVRQLYAGSVNPGPQDVIWNGRDDAGRNLATGVYLARVTVGGTQKLVKMTLVK
ncbi:MAG: hypothetical protein ACI9UQ_000736, partial [Candidatus Krumholzibacteriia bacterium]